MQKNLGKFSGWRIKYKGFHLLPSGAGPRHLLFHPNGRLAFLVYELGNLVSSLSWSPADGFKIVDMQSTLVAFATGSLGVLENMASTSILASWAEAIRASRRGRVWKTGRFPA